MLRTRRKRRRKRKRTKERRRKRRVTEMTMKRSKLLRLGLLRLYRNLMNSMRITMMCGQIEMKPKIINSNLTMTWQRTKSCQNSRMSIRKK